MKSLGIPITAATALSLALVLATGCKDNRSLPSTTQTTAAQPVSTTTTTTAPMLSTDDKDFMTKAAERGMLEIALGKQVSQKAASQDVKTLSNRIVTDRTKADDELKQLAASKGVTLPSDLDKDHQSKLDKLSKLNGVKLDKEYADDMVDDHEADVRAFKKASQEIKDPDLRAWAAKTLPAIEEQLTMAKDVKAKTKR
jgi:putative membrane protein